MIRLYKLILFGTVLAMNGCFDFEIGTEKFERVAGPGDIVPYDALGSGKLAFTRESTGFIIDADTRSSWGIKGYRGGGVISPDGKYVAIERTGSSEAPSELVVYDIGRNNFNKMPGSKSSGNPSWTADSKYVLCLVTGSTDLLVRQSVTGENKSTITTFERGPSGLYGPSALTSLVSASVHDKLAFSLNKSIPGSANSGIFTINMDGTGLTKIVPDTSSTARAASPRWSPNGEQVAYMDVQWNESRSIRQTKVMVVNSDGSNGSALATFQAVGTHPMFFDSVMPTDPSITWSPDGTRLAFNMFEQDGVHIYVMNVDGSGLTKVTSMAGAKDGSLSWSR